MKLLSFALGLLLAIAWLDYLFGARRFHWRWPARSHYQASFVGSLALHPITRSEAMARFPKDYLPGDELFIDRHDK